MRMQIWSDGVILVELPGGPGLSRALESVISRVHDREDYDVVIDFSKVTIISSRSIAPLLRLRELLHSHRKRLLLCGLSCSTRDTFSVTALDGVFEMADDKGNALAALQAQPSSPTATGGV